jgi:hypothetical protein
MHVMTQGRLLSATLSFALNRFLYHINAYHAGDAYEVQWECTRCVKVVQIDGTSISSELAIARGKQAAELHHEKEHNIPMTVIHHGRLKP